jgi:hypothetical protein
VVEKADRNLRDIPPCQLTLLFDAEGGAFFPFHAE